MKLINKIGLITLLGTATLTGCSRFDQVEYIGYKDGKIVYDLRESDAQRYFIIGNKFEHDISGGTLDSAKILYIKRIVDKNNNDTIEKKVEKYFQYTKVQPKIDSTENK